jgi:3-hydroxybutyryl-CoA dehydrogenase
MKTLIKHTDSVLLVGNGDLVVSVAMCLLFAGHHVNVCTENVAAFKQLLKKSMVSQKKDATLNNINIDTEYNINNDCKLVIAIDQEDLQSKQQLIKKIESFITKDAIIAINTESIDLNILQAGCMYPDRLIGLNWTEPANATFFLEIIASEKNYGLADEVFILAKSFWAKDPYIVKNIGIRSRLVSAMVREAFFMVDNGYASVVDIDRACRNDAGYYLPFSGNCRYMDLMGTSAYGVVMKDLNPDLSKDKDLPDFFEKILHDGGLGMENKKGFYEYSDKEVEKWKNTMEEFSSQIHSIIEKYPFNYKKKLTE